LSHLRWNRQKPRKRQLNREIRQKVSKDIASKRCFFWVDFGLFLAGDNPDIYFKHLVAHPGRSTEGSITAKNYNRQLIYPQHLTISKIATGSKPPDFRKYRRLDAHIPVNPRRLKLCLSPDLSGNSGNGSFNRHQIEYKFLPFQQNRLNKSNPTFAAPHLYAFRKFRQTPSAYSGNSGISGSTPSVIAAKVRRRHPCRNLRNLPAADKYPLGAAGGITQIRYAPCNRHLQFPEIAGTVCGNCGDLPYNKCAKLRRARYIERISRWSITCKNTPCFP